MDHGERVRERQSVGDAFSCSQVSLVTDSEFRQTKYEFQTHSQAVQQPDDPGGPSGHFIRNKFLDLHQWFVGGAPDACVPPAGTVGSALLPLHHSAGAAVVDS